LAEYARRRFVRLYLPFIFWCGVVLLLRLAKHKFVGGESSAIDWNPLTILLAGTGGALWYLPYLLLVLLLVRLFVPLIRAAPPLVVHLTCWGIGFSLPFVVQPHLLQQVAFDANVVHRLNGVFYMLTFGLPPLGMVFWGISIGLAWNRITAFKPAAPWLHALLGFASCAGLITASFWLHPFDGKSPEQAVAEGMGATQYAAEVFLLENLAGLSLLYAGLTLPAAGLVRHVAVLGPATLGIFLIHRPLLSILEVAFRKLFWWEPFTFPQAVVLSLVAFTLAAGLAVLFRRTHWLRWSVG
jgi:fucose 4-O-acetylase-like acetyltransferase